jgi:hypothetical protein
VSRSCGEFLHQILYAFPDVVDCLSEIPMIVFARSDIFGGYPGILLNECKTRQYGFDIVLGWKGGVALVARGYFAHWWSARRPMSVRCRRGAWTLESTDEMGAGYGGGY